MIFYPYIQGVDQRLLVIAVVLAVAAVNCCLASLLVYNVVLIGFSCGLQCMPCMNDHIMVSPHYPGDWRQCVLHGSTIPRICGIVPED